MVVRDPQAPATCLSLHPGQPVSWSKMELQPRDPAPERGGLPPPFTSSAWFRGYA